jgi:hypothetical protein
MAGQFIDSFLHQFHKNVFQNTGSHIPVFFWQFNPIQAFIIYRDFEEYL